MLVFCRILFRTPVHGPVAPLLEPCLFEPSVWVCLVQYTCYMFVWCGAGTVVLEVAVYGKTIQVLLNELQLWLSSSQVQVWAHTRASSPSARIYALFPMLLACEL